MRTTDLALRRRLTGAAVSAAVIFAGFAVSYGLVSWLGGSPLASLSGAEEAQAGADPTEVQRLIDEHDCWTGRAPRDMTGEVPGHVVATVSGETTYSAELVGPALESVFGTPAPGLTVHAFCR